MSEEEIDILGGKVKELGVELDIKSEMRSRVNIGELTCATQRPDHSLIRAVEDHQSKWKKPQPRYRRQAVDYKKLGNIGVLGVKQDTNRSRRPSSNLSVKTG